MATAAAPAATHYVNIANSSPAAPFLTWATAATNLQDAIDAVQAGDTVLVTNGVYATGGRIHRGTITNRVVVDKEVAIRSVNGPAVTRIEGAPHAGALTGLGGNAIRCAYLAVGAVLSGFTLTNGFASGDADDEPSVAEQGAGGGAWCETGAVVTNCILSGNFSGSGGGGIYGGQICDSILVNNRSGELGGGGALGTKIDSCILNGNRSDGYGGGAALSTLFNCVVTTNYSETSGGGAAYSSLYQCTIVGNSIEGDGGSGWGAYASTLVNSICYYNVGGLQVDASSMLAFTCSPGAQGNGNIAMEPRFLDRFRGDFRLAADSPCIDAGTNLISSFQTDILGNSRPLDGNGDGIAAFDMGAYEFVPPPPGPATRYVNIANPSPAAPFLTWATAATNIQDAIDAAQAGDTVLVTNGVYATGGRSVDLAEEIGDTTNRVAVTKSMVLQSVNGPKVTVIEGDNASTDGARCVYLTNGATLIGFTLANGFSTDSGGGVICVSNNSIVGSSAVVSNCLVVGSSADYGGGAAGGTFRDCQFLQNQARDDGGGAYLSTLVNCILVENEAGERGGGAYQCGMTNCTIRGNSSLEGGGGAWGGTMVSCTIIGNSTVEYGGGGASNSRLENCLLLENSAGTGGGAAACVLNNCTVTRNTAGHTGGAAGCTMTNCIVFDNTATNRPNYSIGFNTFIRYTCTTPLPVGEGNITNAPVFADPGAGNYHLRYDSPCIDAGTDLSSILRKDLEGRPRPMDGNGDGVVAFDMGAYESGHRWFIPQVVGTFTNVSWVGDVAVRAGLVYLAAGADGLLVIDITDPSDLRQVGHYDTPGSASRVVWSGQHAYVADGASGLQILSIENPTHPIRVGEYLGDGPAVGIAVFKNHAYLLSDLNGGLDQLDILDISDPASPQWVGKWNGFNLRQVALSQDRAYVVGGDSLNVLDVADPANPVRVGGYENDNDEYLSMRDVHIHGSPPHIYVAGGGAGVLTFRPQDLEDPDIERPLDVDSDSKGAVGLDFAGSFAYAACGSSLKVIPVFDPAHIEAYASVAIPSGSAARVAVEGTLAFVAAESGGLKIFRVAMPARLAVTGITDREFHFSVEAPMWSILEIERSYDLRNWHSGYGDIFVQDSPHHSLKDDFEDEPQLFFRAFWR